METSHRPQGRAPERQVQAIRLRQRAECSERGGRFGAPLLVASFDRDRHRRSLESGRHRDNVRPACPHGGAQGRAGTVGGDGGHADTQGEHDHGVAGDLAPRRGVGQSERNGTVHEMENGDLPLVAELVVPADTDMLTVCRTVLAGVGMGLPLSDEALDDLKLVLSEVCAAAMERSVVAGADATVHIAFRFNDSEIEISVGDRGPDRPAAEGGLGVLLLRQLCSRLDVGPQPAGPGTIVRFAQTLPA